VEEVSEGWGLPTEQRRRLGSAERSQTTGRDESALIEELDLKRMKEGLDGN
jgi:hypothetical protein